MSANVILLIEDDLDFRNFVEEVLNEAGYTVLLAENGSQGSKLVNEHLPDLIVTDLLMPEKDGVRFIEENKASHPSIPIIAMSGGASVFSPAFLEAAEKLGASKTLAKPFEIEQLLKLVDECLTQ